MALEITFQLVLISLGFAVSVGTNAPSSMSSFGERCTLKWDQTEAYCQGKQLPEVPEDLLQSIRALFLSHNNINTLRNTSFQPYRFLDILDISFNKIHIIELGTLFTLKNLVELNLATNPGIIIPNGNVFRYAGQLVYLNAESCRLQTFPSGAFKWFGELRDLRLYNNQISFINVTTCNAEMKLNLSHNRIKVLKRDMFEISCHVDCLDLSGNPIQIVDPKLMGSLSVSTLIIGGESLASVILRYLLVSIARSKIAVLVIKHTHLCGLMSSICWTELHNSSLYKLELQSNKLHLYSGVFSNVSSVVDFHIQNSEIETLEPDYFEGMDALRILRLTNDIIINVNPLNLSWTTDLHELHLCDNDFQAITSNAFRGLNNLKLLNLTRNENLKVLTIAAFQDLHGLESLYVSGSYLEYMYLNAPILKSFTYIGMSRYIYGSIPIKLFENMHSLEHITMQTIKLKTNDLIYSDTNTSLFSGLSNLTYLYLRQNELLYMPGKVFENLSFLEELDLSECKISGIDSNAFIGLLSLRILHLEKNQLQAIPLGLLDGLNQLAGFYIDGNRISYLDRGLFWGTSLMQNFTFGQNQLVTLNHSTFAPIMATLKLIDLSSNQLDCTCQLAWLFRWLKNFSGIQNGAFTTCASAQWNSMVSRSIFWYTDDLCQDTLLGLWSTPLAVLALSVTVVIVYRNRWSLRNKMFLLKLAIFGYEEIQDVRDHNEFEFDLNVMFAADDRDWAREHLRHGLEQRVPHLRRNVYGDDGLVVGMFYLEAVLHAVENSFKTIIVISRAAIHDNWFLVKFRIAMDYMNDIQTERLVVIFLEDIPEDELPFMVRLYLSHRTPYLLWPEIEFDQQNFWQSLTKRLTVNLRCNFLIPSE